MISMSQVMQTLRPVKAFFDLISTSLDILGLDILGLDILTIRHSGIRYSGIRHWGMIPPPHLSPSTKDGLTMTKPTLYSVLYGGTRLKVLQICCLSDVYKV